MKVNTFLFHVPKMHNVINYEQLEKVMKKKNAPEVVHVIDVENRKRLGAVPSSLALLKFK